jgi:hypothetical protein
MKYKALLISAGLILATLIVEAQENTKPVIKPVQFSIGIQPGFKPILFNEFNQYAWDINILPFTFEYAMDRHWALRVHSIWDVEVRPENYPTVSATIGFEIAAPFHLSLKNSEEGHRGFFIAPVFSPGYNILNKYYLIGLGGEAGFAILFGNQWTVNISAQVGFQMQKYPNDRFIRYIPYSIPVITLARWL